MKRFSLISCIALLALTGCAVYPTYDNLGGYYGPAPAYSVSANYGYAYVPPPVYVRPAPYFYGGAVYYHGGSPHHGHGGWRH
jgi:hypothetical protein